MAENYDLIVIGAGPAGYVAAIRASQLGMTVALLDKRATLGGTCLNIGCIPSKALLDSTERYQASLKALKGHGILTGEVKLDLAAMMKRKDKVVRQLTGGVSQLVKANKITVIRGIGQIAGQGRVKVQDREIRAERILIATGSETVEIPALPPDGERVITSTEALSLPEVPKELVVVGAGAIGLEMGSVWSRLGARVTVVEIMKTILPGWDSEMARALAKELTRQGLNFELATRVESLETRKTGVILKCSRQDGGETIHVGGDRVLVAVGRRPNTEGLGLEELEVATERGRIQTDEQFQTSVSGIYAVGDVIAGPMLAHKAEEEAVAAVELMAGLAGHINYQAIPNVVYTAPELSFVGKTEEQLKQAGIPYRKGSFPFRANGRALAMGETAGSVKILAHEETDRILGVHILGPHSSNLIAQAVTIMEFGGSAEDLARTVAAHPTLPEAIKEAALAVDARAIHSL